MVVQDGIGATVTVIPILDNLINERRIPAIVGVFIDHGADEGTPTGERSFEYDTVSDAYLTFVETEVLPKVEQNYNLKLTKDPGGRAAMGSSSGGAAAFTMGWFRPDLYSRIICFSGSFTDLQPTTAYPLGAYEYPDHLIADTPAKPLRVALEVGENDLNWNTDTNKDRNWLPANQMMAAALAARGYHYRFVYAKSAVHIDPNVVKQIEPDTLAWLWQGYPIQ
jgi:enterochelin esterase-like enzyme